jgi:uncharacterized protein YkwD
MKMKFLCFVLLLGLLGIVKTAIVQTSRRSANILAQHNFYRAKHHASPLVLSDWLAKSAQDWANYLAKNN